VIGRSSGVLLHPTSLPGSRLGGEAYEFVDWLAAAGQSWWQVLPLGPPDRWGSPYSSMSTFAGWTGLLADAAAPVSADEIEDFVARHPFWAGEWAAFAGPGAIAGQVRFEREWGALRAYAAGRGVRLVGDVPIYVGPGSADHLSHAELFQAGVVAGAPPDAYSRNGQHWGNPLFDWGALRATGYRWWIERLRRTLELVDVTRIDHFRGFVAYWAVPKAHRTARRGRWRRGPGRELFDAVRVELGSLPVIAENLGVITEPVERLRRELGLPGMVVMQWAFAGPHSNPHALANHEENSVVYTATHDTDTTAGWWGSLTRAQQRVTGLAGAEPSWELIEAALGSKARLALVPLQDVLGLGSEARINTPGRSRGNWRWRFRRGALTEELAARLRAVTERHGRAGHRRDMPSRATSGGLTPK
jgi:4-alpha-glucanotransferase